MKPRAYLAAALAVLFVAVMAPRPAGAGREPQSNPIPTLAYYYIWFNASSWDRAKVDYPLLGRYSSDDIEVTRQHVIWAKNAGIDGFIVSWKSTDVLNHRLEQLIQVAEEEDFKLVMIYQGLDFYRMPLPAEIVAADWDQFINSYADSPVFDLFEKPVMIWSGSWEFTYDEVVEVTEQRRDSLLVLASERNLEGYRRIDELVDGNAYYWASVNPETFDGYQEKLNEMGAAVHQNNGIWIPPAAPGFDARLVGGTSIVERKDGDTFRTQLRTAMQSSPDALGIISWNEFSENTHIEPSEQYGTRYLDILGEMNNLPALGIQDMDSSSPSRVFREVLPYSRAVAIGMLFLTILASLYVIGRRRRPTTKASVLDEDS